MVVAQDTVSALRMRRVIIATVATISFLCFAVIVTYAMVYVPMFAAAVPYLIGASIIVLIWYFFWLMTE
jgi:hypothetical protein